MQTGRLRFPENFERLTIGQEATIASRVLAGWKAAGGFTVIRSNPEHDWPESLLEYACRNWPWLADQMLDTGPDLSEMAAGGAELLCEVILGGGWSREHYAGPARLALVGRLLGAGVDAAGPSRPDRPGSKGCSALASCVRSRMGPRNPEYFRSMLALLLSPGLDPETVRSTGRVSLAWARPQLVEWLRFSGLRRAWVAAVVRTARARPAPVQGR